MAPPLSSSQKKQSSLTAFFTPKAANGSRPPPVPPGLPSSSPQQETPSRKRSRDDKETEKDNDLPTRTLKKQRSVEVEGFPNEDADRGNSSFISKSHAGQEAAQNPPASSARTDRYLYENSGAPPAADDDFDNDPAVKKRNSDLHTKFVKKLGHPDAMNWRRRALDDDIRAANDDDAEGPEEEEEPGAAKGKKRGSKTGKLTPMEVQFLDIKRKHMDTVLIVEVGYKFRFFGEDARIAAKELSIVCIPGKMRYDEHLSEAHIERFASASIPVHRLPVHAKRLVAAGHKVGVVRQIETAALKKAGDNRNTPFIRKLTNLYTKGTYVDEVGELDNKSESGSPSGGYLLCITESRAKGWGTDEKVDVAILAVQPATGDIIYDAFEDGFMRSEIETRLLHISPCEFLIVGELTRGTEKLLSHISGSSTNVFGDRSRVERVPRGKTMASEAYSHVTEFYADKLKDTDRDETAAVLLDKVLKLPEQVTTCLSAMITHLKEYGLEHVFDLTKYFQSFSTRSHVLINGTTLESLEVYRNSTDHGERGSLLWAIDKTSTRFGQRLLRKWVGRPLLDRDQLQQRLDAVEELLEKQSTGPVAQLEKLLKITKTDLERSLIRIYYGKCTRPELLYVLQAFQRIANTYSTVKSTADTGFDSSTLSGAVMALPGILNIVVPFLEKINLGAASKDDKYNFFREDHQTEDIQDHQMGIAHIEHELDLHRSVAAAKIKRKTVEYVTVAGIEYLIEVPNVHIKTVPASWAKISGTKKVSRFHTPEVMQFITERDQHREALAAACDKAFTDLLVSVSDHYQPLRDAVSSLATLDCLLSLSIVASQSSYTKPTFLPTSSPPTITVENCRHPIAELTIESGYIPFTTTLQNPSPVAHLITGPNMGGKSSFVRALALTVLLAQIGSFVPADSLSLTLCDAIHTRMGAKDNLFAGESTFMVEVSETARILRSATSRSLVILDELGRGTSTHDGAAIAQAVLEHVVRETKCMTLFITHYQNLARVVNGLDGCSNLHMKFNAEKGPDGEEEITFLYEVEEGVAHRSYGLNVARLAKIPKRVLEVAAEKSSELEGRMRAKRLRGSYRTLKEAMDGSVGQLEHLVTIVDDL